MALARLWENWRSPGSGCAAPPAVPILNPGDVERFLLSIAEQDGKRSASGSARIRGGLAKAWRPPGASAQRLQRSAGPGKRRQADALRAVQPKTPPKLGGAAL